MTIVGLGEALWDILPGGKVLGGAPLNVACHVHALLQGLAGASPSQRQCGNAVVASRVGTDALGDDVVRDLSRRGMAIEFVQRDAMHPTSTVSVSLETSQPTYTFAPNIAWDQLEFTRVWAELAASCDAVCYGTLAQRSPQSRQTIWQFLGAAPQAIRLFDVNLRQGFYDRESIVEGCRRATLIKLNEQELEVVTDAVGLATGSLRDSLLALQAQFGLDAVVFTRGERGTLLLLRDAIVDRSPVKYEAARGADAVGAGDACSAGIIVGWLLGWSPARTVELANRMGALVASRPGATPALPPEITGLVG